MALNIDKPRFQRRGAVQEERQFTNPHVRFRRIKGRIIPIVNKKRIGQDISDVGEKGIKAGAVLAGAGLLKRTKTAKKATSLAKKAFENSPKFKFKSPSFLKINAQSSFKKKAAIKTLKAGFRGAGFIAKNAGKIGIATAGLGVLAKIFGDEVQMRSAFGKDFFFVKDQHGKDS